MSKASRFTEYEADRVPQILAFEAWDKAKRRENPLAGLAFVRRTSSRRCWNLLSRHYPHLLCWQWIVSWSFAAEGERRAGFQFHRTYRGWICHLLWSGHLSYQTQNYDRMAALGPAGAGAPKIKAGS